MCYKQVKLGLMTISVDALSFTVKPLELDMESPSMPTRAGTALHVKCIISGARPAAEAVWYNRTDRMRHQPQPAVEPLGDGTFRTTSTLEVVLSRHDHEGSFTCKGSNPVLQSSGEPPLERTVDLHVQCKRGVIVYSLFVPLAWRILSE